jgi:hypothetical protein
MLDKQFARNVLQQFDFKTMEALEAWITYRTEFLRHATESIQSSTDQIRFAQGGLDELKVLRNIRKYAEQILEE